MSSSENQENPIKIEDRLEGVWEDVKPEDETDNVGVNDITVKLEPLVTCNFIKYEKDDKKIFCCVYCSEFFEYIELYELHSLIHNKTEYEMKDCPCCKKKYKNLEKFILHIQEHLKKYKHCSFCNKIFFNQSRLNKHVIEHKKNGDLMCTFCGKTFQNRKLLTIHTRVHTNERPYACNMCSSAFKQISSLKSHKELIHSEGRPQECEICHGKFCTKSSLNRHMKLHTSGRTIGCKPCKMDFPNKELYNQHKMECHMKLSVFFEICPECNEEFFTYREYYFHTKYHVTHVKKKEKKTTFQYDFDAVEEDKLPSNEKTETCWLCGEVVSLDSSEEHKNKHMLMSPEELLECVESKTFQCKLCKNIYSSRKNLLAHMDVHMDKVHGCTKGCNTNYLFTYFGLNRHERRFHPASKEPKKTRNCFLCGLDVPSKEYYHHLNEHIQMTEEEILKCRFSKEFPCTRCSITVPSRSYLVKHAISHMPKIYTCEKDLACKNVLYSYVGLRSHHRNFHDEFICEHCNTTFAGLHKFKSHHHTSDYTARKSSKKTFKCSWCAAKFTKPMALINHYRNHKNYDFRCRICDKKFPRACDIKNHMNKIHKQKFSMEDCYRYLVDRADTVDSKTEKVFTCNWCRVVLNSKTALTKHEKIHTGKKYQCKKCKTCFIRVVQYVGHIKNNVCIRWMVEALIPEAKELKCFYCDRSFSEYFEVTKHIAGCHLKDPYQCKYCRSTYLVKSLRTHLIKRHPRKKKYFCVGCTASFVTFKAYLQHRKCCVECPLLYRSKSIHQKCISESSIEISSDGNLEDIVDIPEKVVVNAYGEIVVPENGDSSILEMSEMDVDCIDSVG